jgi:uracil-DNA glycosylase family 4
MSIEEAESILSFYCENGIFFCSKKKKEEKTQKTLDELRLQMQNFTGCSLKDTALNLVFSDGNPKADLLLIGEAPGVDEDQQGIPFVGQSGQLLTKMIEAINLDRKKDCYIINVVPWRPPGNRPPSLDEIEQCLPFLQDHIKIIDPKLLVLLGGVATKTILNTKEGILKLRGKISFYEVNNKKIPAIPTFHPSYLLRSPRQKSLAWKDWLFVKQTLFSIKQ